ncbi:hypothetical protein UFOVP919_4 [uncultured Caudovirales phage]|jgi:hypothetical protein|uniref:Uncharacterized protein n=1 Tax=uncultured Caudovirales phage TaxID=2100421 RepID=A0A6J5SI98_9CAUD|nr:hypothetical protein UFOVP832_21 [uncultured Caudovirales phage]CAB4171214.1 hypothetical protein UFOVP919_4 [uncultured Caudovirales phage]CAB4214270.1 hypothetical protein UFOVP1453_26 [uncultured Caudovirales phage]
MIQNLPLPNAWVEKIFARMQGIYGRDFIGQYSTGMVNGIDAGLENAKATWAEELGGFIKWPEAIAYALEHLPERVPNCIQFKQLCRMAPRPAPPEQIEHKITEEQAEANRKRIKDIIDGLGKHMSMKGAAK